MAKVIGVVNYGVAGNIFSIVKALDKVGVQSKVITAPAEFNEVDSIILPGVGSFKDAIAELERGSLLDVLKKEVINKPTLGICLGMHILSKVGFEYGRTDGLSVFDAEVKKIECSGSVPHMGFNKIKIQKASAILDGLDDQDFYFMHSYEVVNYTDVLSLSDYSGHRFVSAISRDHIYGVQFHPEKSRDVGLEVFKNFVNV